MVSEAERTASAAVAAQRLAELAYPSRFAAALTPYYSNTIGTEVAVAETRLVAVANVPHMVLQRTEKSQTSSSKQR